MPRAPEAGGLSGIDLSVSKDDAVIGGRRVGADLAGDHVGQNPRRVALPGATVTGTRRRFHPDGGSGFDCKFGEGAGQAPLFVAIRMEDEPPGLAGGAAEAAERTLGLPEAASGKSGVFGPDGHIAPCRKAAPEPSRPAAVGDQLIAADGQREFLLHRFNGQVGGPRDMDPDGILAIQIGEGARRAGIGFVIDKILGPARIDAAVNQTVQGPAPGHDPIRCRLGQRPHQQVTHDVAGGRTIADRRRRPAVEHAPFRGRHLDGAEVARVGRQAGISDRLDRVVDARQRGGQRHIAGAGDLWIAAREVAADFLALDRDRHLEADEPVLDAVVV